jgi:predicted PurR-regulated permease PerM
VEAEEISRELERSARAEMMADPERDEEVTSVERSSSGEKTLAIESESRPVHSVALKGLFILALFYTFYLARTFLLPIVIALIGTFVLAPMVRWMKQRLWIPEALGAAGILLLIGGVLAYQVLLIRGPVVSWLNEAPQVVAEIQEKVRGPLANLTRATEQIEAATTQEGAEEGAVAVVPVRERGPGWGERVVAWVPFIAGHAAVTVILLFFFLTYGDLFLLKVVKVLPTLSDKKNAVEIAHAIESQISSYLATIAIINFCLGVAIGVAMALWGMPNPILWGVMGGLLNFIPYLGALIGVSVITLVAFTHFDLPSYGVLVPLTYYLLTAFEGYFVTPILLGRRLILNPVVIFLGFIFWGWLWHIPGMLLAVPILAVFKIFCDHIKPLEPVGEFMGR